MNMSKEMMAKVISDAYESTLLDLMADAIQRVQFSTDHREYVEKQSEIIAACIAELKRRKGYVN
jgi:hypothetical protein